MAEEKQGPKLSDEDQLKLDAKKEELKQKRAGKVKTINVIVSDSPNLNFKNCIDEIMELVQMHNLHPDELYMVASQLQVRAYSVKMQLTVNQLQQSMARAMTPEVKKYDVRRKEQMEKEKEEGKKRVGPTPDATPEQPVPTPETTSKPVEEKKE